MCEARTYLGVEECVRRLKNIAWEVEESRWTAAVMNDHRLRLLPKKGLKGRVKYAGRGRVRSLMTLFRLGAAGSGWDRQGQEICVACKGELGGVEEHILIKCTALETGGWVRAENEEEADWCRRILDNVAWGNMVRIYKRWKQWREEGMAWGEVGVEE